jgi:DNA-directed RNA polymerase subunit RPC12/RpoP
MKTDLDCWDNEEIICPYCYEQVNDDDYAVLNSHDKTEVECPYCGKTFYCNGEIKYSYTSTRIGENGEEISEWED